MQINTVREAPGFAVARHIFYCSVDSTIYRCDDATITLCQSKGI